MKALYAYARAQAHWSWLLPPLWLGVMLIYLFASHTDVNKRQVGDLYSIFEYFLPLALALYLADVPAFEKDQGAAETHLGYVQWPSLRLALLALPGLVVWAAGVAAALAVVHFAYLPDQNRALLDVLSRPALALGGVALAGTALARSQVGGLTVAFLWWALDALGQGMVGKQFFLFRVSIMTGLYTPEVQGRNIALLGAAGLAVALWVAHRRSWWIR
jgi:hypothetical protein